VTPSDDAHILEGWLQALHDEEVETLPEHESFVVVLRGDTYLAFPLSETTHIARLTTFSPLPDADPLMPGVTNLEGRVLPILDVSPLIHLSHLSPQPGLYIIVVARGTLEAGILAHKAVDIHDVPKSHIQMEETSSIYIRGTYTWPLDTEQYLVHIVNTERLFEAARSVYE